jgi:hypothetical protein
MPCGVDTVGVRCECVYMSFVLTWFRARLCVPGPLARTAVPRRHSNTPRPPRGASYAASGGTPTRKYAVGPSRMGSRYLRARARRPVRHRASDRPLRLVWRYFRAHKAYTHRESKSSYVFLILRRITYDLSIYFQITTRIASDSIPSCRPVGESGFAARARAGGANGGRDT